MSRYFQDNFYMIAGFIYTSLLLARLGQCHIENRKLLKSQGKGKPDFLSFTPKITAGLFWVSCR